MTDEFGDGYDEIMPRLDLPRGLVATAIFDDLGPREPGPGLMYGWGYEDLDSHLWEIMWMNPAAVN